MKEGVSEGGRERVKEGEIEGGNEGRRDRSQPMLMTLADINGNCLCHEMLLLL